MLRMAKLLALGRHLDMSNSVIASAPVKSSTNLTRNTTHMPQNSVRDRFAAMQKRKPKKSFEYNTIQLTLSDFALFKPRFANA